MGTYYQNQRQAIIWMEQTLLMAMRRKIDLSIESLLMDLSLKHEVGEKPIKKFIERFCKKHIIEIKDGIILFSEVKE